MERNGGPGPRWLIALLISSSVGGIFTSVSTNRSQETLQEEDLVTAELILADCRHAIVQHWGGGAGWFITLLIL